MQELVKSVSIDNMLNQREAAISKIYQAQAILLQAQELTRAGNMGSVDFNFTDAGSRNYVKFDNDKFVDVVKQSVDSTGWQYLLKESGLRTLMDAKAREKWDESIRKNDFPEFTKENIQATFESLYNARGDMFERGVLAVFKRLNWCYKTNKPFKFSKKIIINYLYCGHIHFHMRSTDELDDLMRVFCVMDSKPEPDCRQGMYTMLTNANKTGKTYENDYMHIKWYKKGTGHITFKRMDLIDHMNKILAKHYPDAIAERV